MSLVAWWQLEGDATDELGEYDGYPQSAVYGSGKLGDCYDNSSGGNAGIELLQHDEFTEYESHYSFSFWFKSTATEKSGSSSRRIIARDASEYPTLTIDQTQSSPQDLYFYKATGSNYAVSANEWHHFAFSINTETYESRTFIDGELSQTSGVSEANTSRPYVIGQGTEGDGTLQSGVSFEGKIDDVRLYDHVLSEKEVKQLSQAKVLHYKMNDSEAVTDASGQGNDGTLNGPTFSESSAVGSGSYSFNGSGDFIGSSLFYNTTSLEQVTVSAWYNSSSTTDQIIASSDRDEYWRLGVGSDGVNGVQWTVNSSDMVSSNTSNSDLQDGLWHHIVAVFDANLTYDHKIYVDGQLDSEANFHGSGIGSGSVSYTHIGVGSEASSQNGSTGPIDWINGNLADVRVYHRGLTQNEVQRLYENRASIDADGSVHAHELNDGVQESFESGSFDSGWTVGNATISSTRSYHGNYSFGSWNDGNVDANLNIGDDRKIDSFEYVWKEDTSQSGHVVALNDSNGNVVQESGTENPEWYINDGAGGRTRLLNSAGTSYNVWIRFRFDFDWDAGTFDYDMKKLDGSASRSGTGTLENTNGVSYIRFAGGSSLNNYGSANYCRFDAIKVNDTAIKTSGVLNGPNLNEVGPAPENLVGWWPLDGNVRDYSENGNDGTNNGASKASGLGQGSYDFAGDGNYVAISSDNVISPTEITISSWIYPTSNNGTIVSLGAKTSDNDGILFDLTNGNIRAASFPAITGSSIPTNEWSYVSFTYDGTTSSLYLNGTEDTSNTSVSGSITYNSNRSDSIGLWETGWGSDTMFDGRIQDVRIYDRALTSAEVKQLYKITDPREGQRMMQTDSGTVLTKNQLTELL